MREVQIVRDYINQEWLTPESEIFQEVLNPATNDILGKVSLSSPVDVDSAVRNACTAFDDWQHTPSEDRVQFLFRLKYLLESLCKWKACPGSSWRQKCDGYFTGR